LGSVLLYHWHVNVVYKYDTGVASFSSDNLLSSLLF
jgi:hypothetical protein